MEGKEVLHYFAESAFFTCVEEEDKAREYLKYWKMNLLKKLYRDTYSAEIVDEQYITRDPHLEGVLCQRTRISLKVSIRIRFNFEVDCYVGSQ